MCWNITSSYHKQNDSRVFKSRVQFQGITAGFFDPRVEAKGKQSVPPFPLVHVSSPLVTTWRKSERLSFAWLSALTVPCRAFTLHVWVPGVREGGSDSKPRGSGRLKEAGVLLTGFERGSSQDAGARKLVRMGCRGRDQYTSCMRHLPACHPWTPRCILLCAFAEELEERCIPHLCRRSDGNNTARAFNLSFRRLQAQFYDLRNIWNRRKRGNAIYGLILVHIAPQSPGLVRLSG